MASIKMPEISDIRNRVAYNPETGGLTWLARPESDFRPVGNDSAAVRCRQWNARCAGKPAFATINALGYAVGHFRGKLLAAHRVAFAIMTGRWPTLIDHTNGVRSDNRWCTIKEATPRQNLMNCAVRKDSITGRTGVRPNKRTGRGFVAHIKANGKSVYLGRFATFEEAVAAREAAERRLGYSERHGQRAPDK